jgi:hypothetical protein
MRCFRTSSRDQDNLLTAKQVTSAQTTVGDLPRWINLPPQAAW